MQRALFGVMFLVAGGAVYFWGQAVKKGTTIGAEAMSAASSAGQLLSRGLRNNNPGNIRISSANWVGKIPLNQNTDGVFEQYETPEDGIRAMAVIMKSYRKLAVMTIAQTISRWAPSIENNTQAYIAAVERSTGINRNVPLAYPADYHGVIAAIIRHENGLNPYTPDTIAAGIARA